MPNKFYKVYTIEEMGIFYERFIDRAQDALKKNNREEFNKVGKRIKILIDRAESNSRKTPSDTDEVIQSYDNLNLFEEIVDDINNLPRAVLRGWTL